MKEISKWQRGDLEVKLLANDVNTDTFTLTSNFPMWKIDDCGYSLQTLYNSACSACVQEDVYDENTGEYLYSRDVEPPEVDHWYNPFKSYRYNFPATTKNLWLSTEAIFTEKRTSIWSDGFDKLGENEKPLRAKRFNMGKQFSLTYDPKNPRLKYQLANEHQGYNETTYEYDVPKLDSCLTNDTFTYYVDKTQNKFIIRFFESKSGSLIEYLYSKLPRETESTYNDKLAPIRFYDSLTGEYLYINGLRNTYVHKLPGNSNPILSSFDDLKTVIHNQRIYAKKRNFDSFEYDFYLYGTYKANNYDRPLKDVCTKPLKVDANRIGSWSEIIDKIIADNNLDRKFIMDSCLVLRFTLKNTESETDLISEYEVQDSVVFITDLTTEGTNLPVNDADALENTLSHGIRIVTEDVVYYPSFIINEKLSVGFPVQLCYTTDPKGIRECDVENYAWDEKRQGITFDVVIKSTIINDSVKLALNENELVIDGWDEGYLNPPQHKYLSFYPYTGEYAAAERFYDYPDDYAMSHAKSKYKDEHLDYFAMTSGAYEKFENAGEGDYRGDVLLTNNGYYSGPEFVYNTIPMQANGQIKFIVARTYHCFSPGTYIDDEISITGDFINADVRKRVSFAKYSADVYYEKITNNVDVELPGGVILKANMYDATKICIKDELGTAFNLDKAMIYINELIPNGKACEFALTETPDDFVFVEPFQYNENTGYDEVVIYISAKNSEGLGFNDSSVNFSFELPEEIRKKYNLGTTSWNIGYRTHLPPFLIQGIPEKQTADAIDPVIPSNLSRVNYPAYPYQASRMGWTENYLFTNADPLYHVVASGFVPSDLGDFEFSEVSAYIKDDSTGMKTFLDYSTTHATRTLPTLISGHNEFASTTETTYEGEFTVYEYDQLIKSDDLAARKSWTKNAVNISARCEYDLIAAADALSTHVVRLTEDGSIVIEGA